ncbi:MAG: TIGR03620 family F420-dependent LLM class oxidoreductase [Myxococcales bacterium]|nr:TIGR03620 family F420-dependent LLM class oxidoreductase [Myxococcales bacterium]
MKPNSLGLFLYSDAFTGEGLTAAAKRAEALGFETLWYVEALHHESFACGAHLIAATKTIEVGAGIANVYARDPMAAVQGSRSLHDFSGGRFILGLGVSHRNLVSDVRGHRYQKPLSLMKEYLDGMDAARAVLPGEDPPLVLAALGPKMIALAKERAQGILPANCPVEHTEHARKILGSDKWIATMQHAVLCEDPERARAIGRQALRFYAEAPNYYKNWFRYGFSEFDLENGGSDRLIDALVAWGSLDDIRKRIQEHFDAGATQVAVNAIAAGDDGKPQVPTVHGVELGYASLPDWKLLEALAKA